MPEQRPGSLHVKSSRSGDAVVVQPTGDVDLTGSPILRAELRKAAAEPGKKLVVDLAAVPYMDSSGVATLVEALQLARKSGKALVVSGLSARVQSIFAIAKLEMVFKIVATVEDALKV